MLSPMRANTIRGMIGGDHTCDDARELRASRLQRVKALNASRR